MTAGSFDANISPNVQAHLTAVMNAATALATAAAATSSPTAIAAIRAAQTNLRNAVTVLAADIAANACTALNAGCFAAQTMLWTPAGYRAVEQIAEGELVYARNENDPDGPIEAKVVEKKFQRTGRILHIHLAADKIIRTTPEHPFYVQDRGWTAAGELLVGSIIRTDAGWVEITDLFDTAEYEPVYNLRVADHHTYFVGQVGWDPIWAHNTACKDYYMAPDSDPAHAGQFTVFKKSDGSRPFAVWEGTFAEMRAKIESGQVANSQLGTLRTPQVILQQVNSSYGWGGVLEGY